VFHEGLGDSTASPSSADNQCPAVEEAISFEGISESHAELLPAHEA